MTQLHQGGRGQRETAVAADASLCRAGTSSGMQMPLAGMDLPKPSLLSCNASCSLESSPLTIGNTLILNYLSAKGLK